METVAGSLAALPPGRFVLVYCHAGVGETSLWGVRAFRAAYELVPRILRERISEVIALHVSFVLRAQIYASSTWMQCGEYGKLVYCDLISDLERHLGIDALLAGLDDADVEYDGVMRTWVARDDEIRPTKHRDPNQPLIDISKIDLGSEPAESTAIHAAQSDAFAIGSDGV